MFTECDLALIFGLIQLRRANGSQLADKAGVSVVYARQRLRWMAHIGLVRITPSVRGRPWVVEFAGGYQQ